MQHGAINPWSQPNPDTFEPDKIDPQTGVVETPQQKELRLEMEHFNAIVKSFQEYETWQSERFSQKQTDWDNLPDHFLQMIPNMPQKFKYVNFCIAENQAFLNRIVEPEILKQMMGTDHLRYPFTNRVKAIDLDKVKSTLRQCIRDWSEVGRSEREMCYKPILDTLAKTYPDEAKRRTIKVLNPGCGLGRLTWEIANMGFQSQGNEFSYHMLLASNLILNSTTKVEEFSIFPHIDQVANVWRFRDQCRKISIPDVFPRSLPENSNFSMVAGDFLDVYTDPGSWDVVVTCFFIDTAKNIFDYIATLSRIIPAGGYWINLGPLLFHFEEMMEPSVELTYEELRAIIPQFGFEFKDEKLGMSSTYSRNELSMLQMAYNSAFFVCQRTDTPPIPTTKQTMLRAQQQSQQSAPRGPPPRADNDEWSAAYPPNRPPGPAQPFPPSANSRRNPGPSGNAQFPNHRGDPSRYGF